MTPVFNEFYDLWVHPGQSGFWGAVVAAEMNHSGFYHHREIDAAAPVIVDVGGHYGIFSRFAARKYPAGRVFYIEPHPDNFQIAEKNLAGLANVTMIQGAVTHDENVVLHTFGVGHNSGGSQLRTEGEQPFDNGTAFAGTMRVQCVWLDQLLKFHGLDRIDLLKLDCEGSEYGILTKCPCLRLGLVEEIVGEWHRVPGVPPFDEFCAQHLPAWTLETFGRLDAPLGMFRLTK
jgi:FkbM family methyltransferase